jgi:hypothetical protein
VISIIVILAIIGAILFGAIRIILGWALPVATMRRVDTITNATFIFIFKLWVVAMAGLIVWIIWHATSHPGPT